MNKYKNKIKIIYACFVSESFRTSGLAFSRGVTCAVSSSRTHTGIILKWNDLLNFSADWIISIILYFTLVLYLRGRKRFARWKTLKSTIEWNEHPDNNNKQFLNYISPLSLRPHRRSNRLLCPLAVPSQWCHHSHDRHSWSWKIPWTIFSGHRRLEWRREEGRRGRLTSSWSWRSWFSSWNNKKITQRRVRSSNSISNRANHYNSKQAFFHWVLHGLKSKDLSKNQILLQKRCPKDSRTIPQFRL